MENFSCFIPYGSIRMIDEVARREKFVMKNEIKELNKLFPFYSNFSLMSSKIMEDFRFIFNDNDDKIDKRETSKILTMDVDVENPIKIDVFTHFAPIPWQLGGEVLSVMGNVCAQNYR